MKRTIEVLVVEDNPGDIRLLKEAFNAHKIKNNLNVVTDGEMAMNYLLKLGEYGNAITPDLILLDLNLPKKDGRQVLSEIKTDVFLRKIPVVVLSTSENENDIVNAYNNYANCFISKPLDFNKFMEVIKDLQHFWGSIVKLPTQAHE